MLTAEELGRLSVKHASWLSEGVRSWFTPKQPEMPMTKDLKSQAPSYNKATETPFWQQKGLNKGNEKTYGQPSTNQPYTNQSAKTEMTTQPQYNYFNPPTGHFKTELTPYSYFKPLYDRYPGGYGQAIADSQRWQDEARLAGLPAWKPENLHKPVVARGGNYVGPWEQQQGGTWGFTTQNPIRAGGYQTLSKENVPSIMINPEDASNPPPVDLTRHLFGHELTHAVHSENKHEENIFNKYKNQFQPNFTESGSSNVGTSSNPKSVLDYKGTPTEFGAYLSELRRDWIEKNPGKRLSKPSEAESLLNYYNPENPDYGWKQFIVPEANARGYGYNRQFPTSNSNLHPALRAAYSNNPEFDPVKSEQKELKNLPKGYIPENIFFPPPNISNIQELLPTIMSNPELKRKAILQILSSVVQNKQPQAPIHA